MSQQYDWALAAAVLSSYPKGLSEDALVDILIVEFGWTRDRALTAISEAILKGWILDDGGVLVVAEPRPAPDRSMDPGM